MSCCLKNYAKKTVVLTPLTPLTPLTSELAKLELSYYYTLIQKTKDYEENYNDVCSACHDNGC